MAASMEYLSFSLVCILLIHRVSSAVDVCPDNMQMRLTQDSLAQRPHGEVNLTGSIRLPITEVTTYWWLLIRNRLGKPIVTYYKGNSSTEKGFKSLVEEEVLETGHDHIKSHLRLRVDMTSPRSYEFNIQTKNGVLCGTPIEISFVEPNISLVIWGDSVQRGANISVSCEVMTAAGRLQITLEYTNMNNQEEDLTVNVPQIVDRGSHFDGTQHGHIIALPEGRLSCRVVDDLGKYTTTKLIKAKKLDSPEEDTGWHITTGLICTAVVVGIVVVVIVYIFIYRKKSGGRREPNEINIEMNAEMKQPLVVTADGKKTSTMSNAKIHSLSQHRELSSVRKPGLVLELVWAYTSLYSSKRCENLRRNLLGLDLNVKKKNRRLQTNIDLSDTSAECFVVMLWDVAAVEDEAFQEIALQVEMWDNERDDIMAINVIMDKEANKTSTEDNEDFRYLLWFKEPGDQGMATLAKKIKRITQKQMSSLKGINFIVEGLVWSYVAVYLKTILRYLKEKKGIKQIWAKDNDGKDIHDKFLIIIPKSGRCIPISSGCDQGCYRTDGKLCEIRVDDAGIKGRRFDPAVHVVKANQTSEEFYFIGEFANPVNTLHQLEDEEIVVDNETLVKNFEQRLCYILDHRIHGFRDFYEIVRFDDETPGSPLLNNVLVSHMTRSSPVIDSKVDPISAPRLYVLGDCDGRDDCTLDQPKCGVHHILAAVEDDIDINATLVTTSEFSQGATKRLFNNALRWKDMLCFVWNKRSTKYQRLQSCFKLAKQQSDVCKRVMHVETTPGSMPKDEKNVLLWNFEQTGDNHDRQCFQSHVKDMFLTEEDETLCGLVGIGLALSFFYSYIAYKMTGWDERLNEKKRHLTTLHDKLVIIIPQSGRSLSTIPGCHIIEHDEKKLREYNAAQGDTAKLGEDYENLPALWVTNITADRNYMTTIYKVDGDKQNCAAIEYATPVRTLYVMYNAGHDTRSHTIGQFTEAWLMAEIDMLYQELQKLIKQAKPAIRDNVDLVYVEDGQFCALSEEDYRKKVSKLVVKRLRKLFS